MIEAHLFKMQTNGWPCDNPDCKHNPEYHNQILRTFFIKKEVTCLAIQIAGGREIYCKDCIDVVYRKLKPILDKNLWVFQ